MTEIIVSPYCLTCKKFLKKNIDLDCATNIGLVHITENDQHVVELKRVV